MNFQNSTIKNLTINGLKPEMSTPKTKGIISPNHNLYSTFNEAKAEQFENIQPIQPNSKFNNPELSRNHSNQLATFEHIIAKEEMISKIKKNEKKTNNGYLLKL